MKKRFLDWKRIGLTSGLLCLMALSACPAVTLAASYVDLSHQEEAHMPVDPSLKLPEQEFFSRIDGDKSKFNLEVISFCPHTGTHMDAPFHVNPQGHTVEAWPADVLIGPAVVVAVGHAGNYTISKADIVNWEKHYGEIQAHEGVLLHTGHDANWTKGYDAYIGNGYPTISLEAAQYLASKKIRYIAVEAISPEGNSSDVHKTFMNQGIPVIENICNLAPLAKKRIKTTGTFPAVKGATGVWIRLLAEE